MFTRTPYLANSMAASRISMCMPPLVMAYTGSKSVGRLPWTEEMQVMEPLVSFR